MSGVAVALGLARPLGLSRSFYYTLLARLEVFLLARFPIYEYSQWCGQCADYCGDSEALFAHCHGIYSTCYCC